MPVRSLTTRLAALLLLVAGAGPAGLALVTASPASAHAALVSTDPADGSTVRTAPTTVTLTFNEVVGQSAVVVTAPDGSRVSGKASSLDRTVSVDLEGAGQRGRYRVVYRVVSADGHPVSGSLGFTTTTGEVVTQATQPADAADEGSFVHRHRSHIAWSVGAGVVGVLLVVWPLIRRRTA